MVVEADAHGYAPAGVSSLDTPGPMGVSSVPVGADGPTTVLHRPWTTMGELPDGRVPSGGSSHELVNDFLDAEAVNINPFAVKEEAGSSNEIVNDFLATEAGSGGGASVERDSSLRDLLQAMRSSDRQDAVRDFQEKEGWKEEKREMEEKIERMGNLEVR